jgi:uncharacterized membrane protein YkoI
MKPRNKLLAPAIALSIVAATAGGAFAANNDGNNETNDQADVQMMAQAKISLADAIQVAETAKGGKALSASFERKQGQPAYQVELALADGTTEAVLVDAQTGKVLKTLNDNEQGEDSGAEQGESD